MTYFEFIQKVPTGSDECINFPGHLTRKGYGQVWAMGRLQAAYRVAYELHRGAIPAGMDVDHLCRNRACVNPRHLEPVTHHENLLRGDTVAAINAAKTHCLRGHVYDSQNTYVRPNGSRCCRACGRDRVRRARGARKAKR